VFFGSAEVFFEIFGIVDAIQIHRDKFFQIFLGDFTGFLSFSFAIGAYHAPQVISTLLVGVGQYARFQKLRDDLGQMILAFGKAALLQDPLVDGDYTIPEKDGQFMTGRTRHDGDDILGDSGGNKTMGLTMGTRYYSHVYPLSFLR
jgi:hypothetical protein